MQGLEKEIYDWLVSLDLEEKYSKPGIYCIKILGNIVYIGKSRDMLVRIANHIKELRTLNSRSSNKYKVLAQAQIQGYKIEFDVMYYSPFLLDEEIIEDIGAEEGRLIREYRPILNYQIPREDNWHKYTINKAARSARLEDIVEVKIAV